MITEGLILILATIGLVQGAFVALYLLSLKKGNRLSNVLLALLVLGLSVRIGKSVLEYYLDLEAWQKNIGLSGILIVGPALLLYGSSLLNKKRNWLQSDFFHFIPVAATVVMIPFIPSKGEFEYFWNYGVVVLHLAIYLVWSWRFLIRQKTGVSRSTYSWYRNLLIGVSFVWLYYLGNLLDYNLHYTTGPIFYSLLIYCFSYLLFSKGHQHIDKYSSSKLDRLVLSKLFQKLSLLFEQEELYLESGVNLKAVAQKMEVNPRELSQAINDIGNQNFQEFVNQYRVNKAKDILTNENSKSHKIATIAFESGFGTVASFNVAFKKSTGLSPSLYRAGQK